MNDNDIVEINSLSVQSAEYSRPHEILVPTSVTERMLKNADVALGVLKEALPNETLGISLHTGSVIDLDRVRNSEVPVTSIDIPDIGYPSEFLKKVKDRPDQIINHVAWRLNSVLGWNEESAKRNLIDNIGRANDLVQKEPFIRMSVSSDLKSMLDIIRSLPSISTLAIEYNAESGFNLSQYLKIVKTFNKENPNIGLSIDLAHVWEYFKINDKRDSQLATEATMNWFESLLKDPQNSTLVASLDINNLPKDTNSFGQTHALFIQQQALELEKIVKMYRDANNNVMKGNTRMSVEFSPRDLRLFIDPNSNAKLLASLSSVNR